jgi:HTH-type transcriptional regulator, sugar sensing transcriptional regulator
VKITTEERVFKTLTGLGFSEIEAQVYVFLSKKGLKRGRDISLALKMNKQQLYPSLKNLQSKGVVSVTLEHPAQFSAIPFDKVLDLYLRTKMEEVRRIQQSKDQILNDWQSIVIGMADESSEKFMVFEGKTRIFSRLQKMIHESKRELLTIASVAGLTQADDFGIFEQTQNYPLNSSVTFKCLIDAKDKNVEVLKNLIEETSKGQLNIEARNPILPLKNFPTLVIRDNEEILLFIKPLSEKTKVEENDACLWTDCKTIIGAFITIFEELWRNSVDIDKNAPPFNNSFLIEKKNSPSQNQVKQEYEEKLSRAESEVIILTSSQGLIKLYEQQDIFSKLHDRNVLIKILAPVERKNSEIAKSLSKFSAIKHVPANYVGVTIIDGKHLFQSQNFSSNEWIETPLLFYSNSNSYITRILENLKEMWETAQQPSNVTLESITGPYGYNQFPFPKEMKLIGEQRTSVPFNILDIKPPGSITEQDILNKILTGKKHRIKGPNSVNVMYASAGSAVIHPPEYFNLPRMLINVNHIEKRSSLGEAEALEIHLWLDTPKGYNFVPMGGLGDNSKGLLLRKSIWAGTPFEKNYQLGSRDKLQVRVYGNSLFAGWTVPIKLDPWKHVLPPGCIIFEGQGNLKSSSVTVMNPGGVKVEREQNWFDAFVTFMHPASKYSGPGTDGLFARDLIVTTTPPKKQ